MNHFCFSTTLMDIQKCTLVEQLMSFKKFIISPISIVIVIILFLWTYTPPPPTITSSYSIIPTPVLLCYQLHRTHHSSYNHKKMMKPTRESIMEYLYYLSSSLLRIPHHLSLSALKLQGTRRSLLLKKYLSISSIYSLDAGTTKYRHFLFC